MVVVVRSTIRDTDAVEMLRDMGAEVEYFLKHPHREYDMIIDDRSPAWNGWEEVLDIASETLVTLDITEDDLVHLSC